MKMREIGNKYIRAQFEQVDGRWYVQQIIAQTTNGWKVILEGQPDAEFATALDSIGAESLEIAGDGTSNEASLNGVPLNEVSLNEVSLDREPSAGQLSARLVGFGQGWSATEEITLLPDQPVLRRRQTYRFTKPCRTAISPGFLLRNNEEIRYTFPLRAWEKLLDDLSPMRIAVDWALPFPFHVWHDSEMVAMYGLDKSVSRGTLDFEPVNSNGYVRLNVYYPDTALQAESMSATSFGQPSVPEMTDFKAGDEITINEIIAIKVLEKDQEPLLEAERIAFSLLMGTSPTMPELDGVIDNIVSFYDHCELWEPDAFGPGRGWFTNMWVHTQDGKPKKRGEMSGYFDFGWGEGIAVEMMLGAVRHWKRTGDERLLKYVDTMTRSIERFKRGSGDNQPYFDRSDGKRFGDFLMDVVPGNRIWTHSLGHIGSQLLQLYQTVSSPRKPESIFLPTASSGEDESSTTLRGGIKEEVLREWLNMGKSIAGFLAEHQRQNGDLQDIFDDDNHEVNNKPHRITARAVVCGLWARLSRITGEMKWLKHAIRLAQAVAPEIECYEYYNQMIDGIVSANVEYTDGESAYYVLEGLVPLYAVTRDSAILTLCRKATAFGIAWTYFYNLPNAHKGIARGGQCCRMDDFPLLYTIGPAKCISPMLELYSLTGDELFRKMAEESVAFIANWQIRDSGRPWDGGMIHALAQYCQKHWGPELAGQVDTGMATGNCLSALSVWQMYEGKIDFI